MGHVCSRVLGDREWTQPGGRVAACDAWVFGLTTPEVPPSAWARSGHYRARTPAGEVYAEGMKARVATAVGFVARLRCVEAGARGVAVWPHPRVSGCGLPVLWCLCPG